MTTRARRVLHLGVGWASFALLWLLFAGSVAWPEVATAAFTAIVASFAMQAVETARLARFAARARWLSTALLLPGYAVSGTWEILAVLARHLARRPSAPSLLYAVPYRATGDDAEAATLRALAVTYTTITPNFVVVGIDRDRGLLLFHQVRRSAVPRMTRALGAEGFLMAGTLLHTGAQEEKPETSPGGVPWSMQASAYALLAFALALGLVPRLRKEAFAASTAFEDTASSVAHVLGDVPLPAPARPCPITGLEPARGLAVAGIAIVIALGALFRPHLPRTLTAPIGASVDAFYRLIRPIHTGHVGDYVTWLVAGIAALGIAAEVLLAAHG